MIVSIEVDDSFIFKEEWKKFDAIANGQAIAHGFSALLLASNVRTYDSSDSESYTIPNADKKVYDLEIELRLCKAQYEEIKAQYDDIINQNAHNLQLDRERNSYNERVLRQGFEQEKMGLLMKNAEECERIKQGYEETIRNTRLRDQETYEDTIARLRKQIVDLRVPANDLQREYHEKIENERLRMNDMIAAERNKIERELIQIHERMDAERLRMNQHMDAEQLRMTQCMEAERKQHAETIHLLKEQLDKTKYIKRLGDSMEEHFTDFTSTLEPLKTMMSTNKGKGNFGEERVEEIITENFPTCDISDVSKRGKSGDRMFILDGLRFIVEVKNTAKVSTDLINEFLTVVERRKNEVQCFIMVSLRAPFPGKGRLHIDVNGSCIVGYVQLVDESALTCLIEVMKQYSTTIRNMIVSRDSNESLYVNLVGGITEFINASLDDFTHASEAYTRMKQQVQELMRSIDDGDKRISDIKNRLTTFTSKFTQIKLRDNTFITPTFTDDELRKIRDMKKKRTLEAISSAIGRDKTYIKARGKMKDIIKMAKNYETDDSSSDDDSD